MHARPFQRIQGSPWTLVVFHRLEDRDRFLVHVLMWSALWLVIYLIYLGGIGAVVYIVIVGSQSRQKSTWYVPSSSKLPSIVGVLCAFQLMMLLHGATIQSQHLLRLWILTFAYPIAVVMLVWAGMARAPLRTPRAWGKWPRLTAAIAMLKLLFAVVLLSCIPAISFFKLSYLEARVPYRQGAQLQLSHSPELRKARVQEQFHDTPLDERHAQKLGWYETNLTAHRLEEILDRYDKTWWFNATPSAWNSRQQLHETSGCEPDQQLVNCQLSHFLPEAMSLWPADNSMLSVSSWHAFYLPIKDASEASASTYLEMAPVTTSVGPTSRSDPNIVSLLPPFPNIRFAAVILNAVSVILGIILVGTLNRRFLWWRPRKARLPDITPLKEAEDKLVLAYPRRDSKLDILSDKRVQYYSLVDLLTRDDWAFDNRKFLVILEVEEGIQDQQLCDRTLRILEKAIADPERTIVVVSTIDPLNWLFEDLDYDTLAVRNSDRLNAYIRWASVCNAFHKELMSAPVDGEWTREDCHLLWKTCTPREKLVLWHLASSGVPNPRNAPALDHLIERGLVKRCGTVFRVSNTCFAAFVSSDIPRREVMSMFPVEADNAWLGLRWVLAYTSLALFLIILLNVADLWEYGAVKLLTLGATTVPLIKTAYDAYVGFRTGARQKV